MGAVIIAVLALLLAGVAFLGYLAFAVQIVEQKRRIEALEARHAAIIEAGARMERGAPRAH
ncbi:MAG: hypothetical protein Q8L86_03070 [Vicinamibacterales bacterium]|nr:hypothetical protein [Vicinamibacterales bacterium]